MRPELASNPVGERLFLPVCNNWMCECGGANVTWLQRWFRVAQHDRRNHQAREGALSAADGTGLASRTCFHRGHAPWSIHTAIKPTPPSDDIANEPENAATSAVNSRNIAGQALNPEPAVFIGMIPPMDFRHNPTLGRPAGPLTMIERKLSDVQISYDLVADEYVRRISGSSSESRSTASYWTASPRACGPSGPLATSAAGRGTWPVTSVHAACRLWELTCRRRWFAVPGR